MSLTSSYITGDDLFAGWQNDVLHGKGPVLYPIGDPPLDKVQVGPGLVTLLGGAPGAGKTAFAMQATVDALRLNPELKAMVLNVEMAPTALMDRQLARVSGIDGDTVRYRRFDALHRQRLDTSLATMQPLADRLAFLRPPYSLGQLCQAAQSFEPHLIVVDYIQRLSPPEGSDDPRQQVTEAMSRLREFAECGAAVIVVSALSRTKDNQGRSSYAAEGLNLASFRETSELEYGADDAYVLCQPRDATEGEVELMHVKSRYGAMESLRLRFDRARQRFEAMPDEDEALNHLFDAADPEAAEDMAEAVHA